jgi:hypothetical protein
MPSVHAFFYKIIVGKRKRYEKKSGLFLWSGKKIRTKITWLVGKFCVYKREVWVSLI